VNTPSGRLYNQEAELFQGIMGKASEVERKEAQAELQDSLGVQRAPADYGLKSAPACQGCHAN
jgi:hypothetical protein